jgi:hypothetical protein
MSHLVRVPPRHDEQRIAVRRIAVAVIPQILLAIFFGAITIQSGAAADKEDHFERHVRPLLIERCHKVTIPDFHATILHTLGLDQERLTFRHAGRDHRLTDAHGHVVREIVA